MAYGFSALNRSSYATEEGVVRQQPIQFSHEHHVGGLGIDCRYCHTSVEVSPFAGLPPTETCMNCHAYIWSESPFLAPVRESFRTGQPLVWTRVYGGSTVNRGDAHQRSIRRCSVPEGRPRRFGGAQRARGT